MAKTINDLENALKKHEAEKAKLEAEIQQLQAQAEQLATDAEVAAVTGNVDKFRSMEATRNSILTDVKYRQIRLEKLRPFTTEDVKDVWDGYCKAFEKDLPRRSKLVDEAKRNLVNSFVELVDLQNELFKTRDRLETFAGEMLNVPVSISYKTSGDTTFYRHAVDPIVALVMEALPDSDPHRQLDFFVQVLEYLRQFDITIYEPGR